jgi:hypothetical protein
MRTLDRHAVRALVGAWVVVGGCAGSANDLQDPSKAYHSISAYGSMQQVSGNLAGERADPITGMPSPAAVPYTERMIDVGTEFVMYPNDEHTALGTSIGMIFGAHIGYATSGEKETASGTMAVDRFLPLSMGITAGTGLTLVRRSGLLVALHSSMKLGSESRLGDTESPFVVYAGVRGDYEHGRVRTHLGYDFLPFWAGLSRLEHRLTGLVSTRPGEETGYGLRAAFAIGQTRLTEGGLNDMSFTIGLEVQR